MIHIDFHKDSPIIHFSVSYDPTNDDPQAFLENKKLRENLEDAGCKTLNHKLVLTEPTGGVFICESGDYCFYVEASLFPSFDNLIEKALRGFSPYDDEANTKDYQYSVILSDSLGAKRLEKYSLECIIEKKEKNNTLENSVETCMLLSHFSLLTRAKVVEKNVPENDNRAVFQKIN